MNKHRTSLKDLAEELGVSIATVSRALRNSHEVGEEMRRKVKELARLRNYRPNPFAQGLRKEAPKVIGVILPNLRSSYYAAVLDSIEAYALERGYSVISTNSREDTEVEKKAVENFLNLHVEGIIACLAQTTKNYDHFLQLEELGVPMVFFARCCLEDKFSRVIAAGESAAEEATRHLIESGCRRVAFIAGPNHLDMVRRRKHGYLEALKAYKIPIDRDIIYCNRVSLQSAKQVIKDMLTGPNPPDGILAYNDIITYASVAAIRETGKRMPDDVSLIGFSFAPFAPFLTPSLSTIVDRVQEEGEAAGELLFRQINGDRKVYKKVIPMNIIIRESSKKK